ncbi:MAG TPA: tRNA pseudouridine(55) synthase TruB [Bacteroidia bacterium]|jgi:tRNA pseudouridine55 synthase|nr:tRNA pseudouridine(55) synthase TruB [Bacteroidia bacterium]
MHSYDFRAGEVLLIDKPLTWTSFQVVNKMKYLIKNHPSLLLDGKRIQPKIGHAGTLDPLATGLLIVCTGKQTKNIEQYQAQEKEYTGTFYIGATTPCYDLEKEIDTYYPTEHISEQLIRDMVTQFIGKQQQTPPLFSAIKIDGKRAYDIARAGQTAEIKSKEITISTFEITRIALPEVDFRVVCSKGTYIRSLARDFGLALKSGAHLTALCRTRIGDHKLGDALTLTEFERKVKGTPEN